MEIYLVRHGETDWNKAFRFQGGTDIELNAYGRELAGITGRALEETAFDVIYSSPLIRAYETACLIRGHRNIPIIRDERLREISFGEYEGKDTKALLARESDPFHYFFSRPERYQAPPGGESLEAICSRTAQFLIQEIETRQQEYQRIMIVAHGACNKALMCHIRQHGLDQYWSGNLQKNCSVSIIELEQNHYTVLEDSKLFYPEKAEEANGRK